MMNFWDERFASEEYVYGKEGNKFLAQQLKELKPGIILLPGEGEGRNAVHAALNNWNAVAFDQSIEGQKKALKLASDNNCTINYSINAYQTIDFEENTFDAIGLFFTHVPPAIRTTIHKNYTKLLKPGGTIIMEAFSKEQINYNTGGPNDLSMLFSKEEMEVDFKSLSQLKIETNEVLLNEGLFHQGNASVIRLVGIK